jgi:hypothetical protein
MMTFVDDEFSAHCDAGFMPTLAGAAFPQAVRGRSP